MAKIQTNEWVEQISHEIIEIIKKQRVVNEPDHYLAKFFIEKSMRPGNQRAVQGVLTDCKDRHAQLNLTKLLSYALCYLKVEEKDSDVVNGTQREDNVFISVCRGFLDYMFKILKDKLAGDR